MKKTSPSKAVKRPKEEVLKLPVAKWLRDNGYESCYAEFGYLRRADVVAFSGVREGANMLTKIFLEIPFDHLAAQYTKKYFSEDLLIEKYGLSRRKVQRYLNTLTSFDYLARSPKGYRVISLTPPIEGIVAVECKLYDWRGGLEQALAYSKIFSTFSYLAVPEEVIKNIDARLLKQVGVGLLAVDLQADKVRCTVKARKTANGLYSYTAAATLLRNLESGMLQQLAPSF